jgi:hypothetical protein
MLQTTPACINLLRIIADKVPDLTPLFDKRGQGFLQLKELINLGVDLDKQPDFIASPLYVQYLQICMLLGLSLFGGVFVPVIKQIKLDKNDEVYITWDSRITDSFTFGKFDNSFMKFASYYQDRLSSKPQNKTYIPSLLVYGINEFLKDYVLVLDSIENEIKKLLGPKDQLLSVIESHLDRSLLFIIISCLPAENMNALFVYVQQFFPEELEVSTNFGRKINVVALFQTPSVNTEQLLEKSTIYLDLYYGTNMPIIKEITTSKTSEFLKKTVINDQVFAITHKNIKAIRDSQIKMRKELYSCFIEHITLLQN